MICRENPAKNSQFGKKIHGSVVQLSYFHIVHPLFIFIADLFLATDFFNYRQLFILKLFVAPETSAIDVGLLSLKLPKKFYGRCFGLYFVNTPNSD
jgi:hypothetical protein